MMNSYGKSMDLNQMETACDQSMSVWRNYRFNFDESHLRSHWQVSPKCSQQRVKEYLIIKYQTLYYLITDLAGLQPLAIYSLS